MASLDLDDATKELLLDPAGIDAHLDEMPREGVGPNLHACTHTTFSCNTVGGGPSAMKTNVIPDAVDLAVDISGPFQASVATRLTLTSEPRGDLYDKVDVEVLMDDEASMSRIDTPLWDALARSTTAPFPDSRLSPQFGVGLTDSRIYREMGAVSYGAGQFSPSIDPGEFGLRFHGNDERIDVESLGLTTQLWLDVVRDMMA